ncbi:alpha/beta-hydrolase [Rickenella mellea]|uniref:triacylglycerol lipase n=1 Tax=Rickenella mellea TaxID=50990 RepID=A0A4Y7PV06_9AGAM|nr:alpha/beta-hydrolase [Rickenella mellea]
MFSKLPLALQLLISPIITLLGADIDAPQVTNGLSNLRFQLRHVHAVANDSRILFNDVPPSFVQDSYSLQSRRISTHQRATHASLPTRLRYMANMQSEAYTWEEVEVPAPNVESRETLLHLAKMTSNSYFSPGDKGWYDLGDNWNTSFPFGWEPDDDGFRGHVFVSDDNSTVVLSIKGTSPGWLAGDGGPTVKKDKLNDNLLFSCCCARVGPTWSTVCGCYSGGSKCDISCLQQALIEDSLFYNVAINLYNNVTYMYPDSNIWLAGHSLGGSLAALLGATFGAPVVAFEAPGEKRAAQRLHLPSPPSTQHITHVINTGDQIAMGACTGVTSLCAVSGYAMETRCHLGKVILYDTVSRFNWGVDIRNHGIKVLIDKVLTEDWEPGNATTPRRQVPPAKEEEDCVDCYNWEFGDYLDAKAL